jgi:type I restriction enzyme S subunit
MPEGVAPSGWQLLRLDELGTVERGRSRHRPRNDPALYGGPYPFVQTGDIKAAGLRLLSYTQTYSEAGLAQSRMWPAGTLCITIAANICDTAILGMPACFPDSIVGFAPKPGVADAVFVKYALDHAKQRFAGISRGATQDNLSLEKMLSQRLPVPPFDTQRRIASILGAYDDLIEVNRRRITLLEEMGRRLFEEWFVRFRFPGHAGAAVTSDREARLPEGWRTGIASDLVDFDPSTRLPRAGRKPFIPMASLNTRTSIIEGVEERVVGSGTKFKNGDTLFARITPCLENGKTGLVRDLAEDGVGFGSTEFIVMRGGAAGPAFTYFLARHEPFRAHAQRSMSGASGRQRARTESVRLFELVVPPVSLLNRFEALAWPMLQIVGRLGVANHRLAASRDLLLPRLISGDLSIAAGEREMETAA